MSGINTNQRVALVEASRGLDIETFDSKFDMVLALMNSGSLGGGGCYGDHKHLEALKAIEDRIPEIRKLIERHWDDETWDNATR